jgi:hypothetical protein
MVAMVSGGVVAGVQGMDGGCILGRWHQARRAGSLGLRLHFRRCSSELAWAIVMGLQGQSAADTAKAPRSVRAIPAFVLDVDALKRPCA